MNKFKRLTFIATTVVTAMLAIGSLATPAQANHAAIVTTTPTGTPITEPNVQGEPVFPEQQEEIKGVIQSYFEMRYQALSVSPLDGFQISQIGDQISVQSDANAFLEAELGKLELEKEYAEFNRSRYVYYKYFLNFDSFALDTATQLVTVSLVEDNETISEISAQNDSEIQTLLKCLA